MRGDGNGVWSYYAVRRTDGGGVLNLSPKWVLES